LAERNAVRQVERKRDCWELILLHDG
jgi:hypothetical protein